MKICSKCGITNTDEALFCSACGTPIAPPPVLAEEEETGHAAEPIGSTLSSPAQVSEQPAYTYTPPAYNASYTPVEPAVPVEMNTATLWLVLNIVITVICCCQILAPIASGIGIVFAALGMGSYNKGDYEDMKSKTKISMILFLVSVGLVFLGVIIGLASGVYTKIMNGTLPY